MKIYDNIELNVQNSNSRIGFEKTGGGSWEIWDRFITIDKQKVFHIGNICGTCGFFFLKQQDCSNLDMSEKKIIEKLNDNNEKIVYDDLIKLSEIIPNGAYNVIIGELTPSYIMPNSINDYFMNEIRESWGNYESGEQSEANTEYFRGDTLDFGIDENKNGQKYFEFLIPQFESEQLDFKRVNYYKTQMELGLFPTILTLGILDVKTSMQFPEIDGKEIEPNYPTHWCFANYLVDGHHKLRAAAEIKKPIRIISFVSKSESWQLIDKMIEKIKNTAGNTRS